MELELDRIKVPEGSSRSLRDGSNSKCSLDGKIVKNEFEIDLMIQ